MSATTDNVPKLVLTDQGADMIARSVAQEKLYITGIAMGAGQLANVGGIPGLTGLVSEKARISIVRQVRSGRQLRASGPVNIPSTTQAFKLREVGIFGHIGTEADQLMGYYYLGETGETVSPADGVERSIYVTMEIDPAANVEVVLAPRETIAWEDVTDKPQTYAPAAHTHTPEQAGAAPAMHNHAWDTITDKPSSFTPSNHNHGWGSITGKPGTFPPSSHSHDWNSITGKPGTFAPSSHSHDWSSITGKPSTFTPSAHTHTPEQAGALPITGGTLTGNLRLKNNNNYGLAINFGDGDYVKISEPVDDVMEIHAKEIRFTGDAEESDDPLPPEWGGTGKTTPLTPGDIGAAPTVHSHQWSQISGAPAGCNIGRPGGGASSVILNDGGYTSDGETSDPSANGQYSVSQGYRTSANNFSSMAVGQLNKPMTTGGTKATAAGDAFAVGNGYRSGLNLNCSNAFRVTYGGAVYGLSSFKTTGADYAEYFEWLDENPEGQDRVGYFVTLEGQQIKLAGPGDYVLGIVSGNPCIIGNADEDWLGRWLHDDFDRFVREYLETTEEPVEIPANLEGDELRDYLLEHNIETRDGVCYQKTVTVVDHETPSWRYKQNPDYDPSQTYIERKDRPEWAAVGMMGVLAVWDDGTCQVNGFCQVAQGGIATAAEGYVPGMTWRVIERVNESVVKVVFR